MSEEFRYVNFFKYQIDSLKSPSNSTYSMIEPDNQTPCTVGEKIAWKPLESNPQALNGYMQSLGVPEATQLVDVFSLDPDCLSFVPQPCLALILLFPLTKEHEDERKKLLSAPNDESLENKKAMFIRQTISNACGTMAILHAILNNLDRIELKKGVLQEMNEQFLSLSPEKRAKSLESNSSLAQKHGEFAEQGQTESLSADSELNLHFTTFVHIQGRLVELDGRHPHPKDHGPCPSSSELLPSAARHIMEIMRNNPTETQFNILALIQES